MDAVTLSPKPAFASSRPRPRLRLRRTLAGLLALLVVVLATPWLGTRVAQASPVVELEQLDGTLVRGEVQRVEADRLVLLFNGRAIPVPFESLTPYSIYTARQVMLAADDAQGHLDLGLFAQERGLYEEAARSFLLARQAAERLGAQAAGLRQQARSRDAHRRFREARQLEQGRQLEAALAAYLQIYAQFPDVNDESLQTNLVAHIRTLQHDLGLDQRLPQRPSPEGLRDEHDNAENGNDNDNGRAQPDETDDGVFDDTSGMSSREANEYEDRVQRYRLIVQAIQNGEQAVQQALTELADADVGSQRIDRLLAEAYQHWWRGEQNWQQYNAALRENWPRLRLLYERLGPRLQQLYVGIGEANLNRAVRRSDMAEANRWVNRLLARDPENELARRTRLLLTEQALRDNFRR